MYLRSAPEAAGPQRREAGACGGRGLSTRKASPPRPRKASPSPAAPTWTNYPATDRQGRAAGLHHANPGRNRHCGAAGHPAGSAGETAHRQAHALGRGHAEFVRPVHWVLMLLGDKLLKAEILGLHAGNKTYGHRFHHPAAIVIKQPGGLPQAAGEDRQGDGGGPGRFPEQDRSATLVTRPPRSA